MKDYSSGLKIEIVGIENKNKDRPKSIVFKHALEILITPRFRYFLIKEHLWQRYRDARMILNNEIELARELITIFCRKEGACSCINTNLRIIRKEKLSFDGLKFECSLINR